MVPPSWRLYPWLANELQLLGGQLQLDHISYAQSDVPEIPCIVVCQEPLFVEIQDAIQIQLVVLH
jgi:hypothetical protein